MGEAAPFILIHEKKMKIRNRQNGVGYKMPFPLILATLQSNPVRNIVL